jgi:site-specific DNA recombinase
LTAENRYAALLRCSDEELQNPELSLDRQLRNCQGAVARWGGQIVAVYYEIETGTSRLEDRGSRSGLAGFDIPIPRAGGLPELLADAARTPRPFDRVVCESINRAARNSLAAFMLEDELKNVGLRLHCADEPFEESFGSIVLRHINIGLAVGYHHNLMVASRQGLETGIRQGWHMGGRACYGYQFIEHPHPNPHKAQRGLVRRTLDLDPVRAPVVRRIFDEYLYGSRGLVEIRDLLNSDPDRFPPPVAADPSRSLGMWSKSSLWEILRNPKYTGYQVWNRRAYPSKKKAGRGRHKSPEEWIWSDQPSHPPIVSREEHHQVQVRAARNAGSRRTTAADSTKTDYLFRGRLRCGDCGLRMWGHRRYATRYYQCQPSHQRAARIPCDHPKLVYLREAVLLQGVTDFLAAAVYGPDRTDYWRTALTAAEQQAPTAPAHARVTELEQQLADLEARLHRQVLALEEDGVDGPARRRIATRIGQLESDLAGRQTSLARLRDQQPPAAPPAAQVAELLATFPIRAEELRDLPQAELRALLDSLDLMVTYDHRRHTAEIELTLASNRQGDDSQDWLVAGTGFEPV